MGLPGTGGEYVDHQQVGGVPPTGGGGAAERGHLPDTDLSVSTSSCQSLRHYNTNTSYNSKYVNFCLKNHQISTLGISMAGYPWEERLKFADPGEETVEE